MIDVRSDSIIYQSQVYYTDLINDLVEKRRIGRAWNSKWEKADTISGYLDAYNQLVNLTDEQDITDTNYILEALIILCELNQYPVAAPIEFQEPPAVLVGIPGDPGEEGAPGATGPAGLATDFQVSLVTVPTVIDSFDITDAKAARWDYHVVEATGEQRAGQIIGQWLPDGSDLVLFDSSTTDLGVGSTDQLEFSLEFLGGEVRLIATPASGSWTVVGSRYFIPNNGNGSGPISDVLANGTIFIGNASNVAQSRSVSGVINITNTGVTSFVAQSIVNADISNTAAIALSKLGATTASRILGTSVAGLITALDTATYPNLTELSYVKGATSALQVQITGKLTDPMSTIGDLVIRNASNITDRLGIGTTDQYLGINAGLPAWVSPITITKVIDIGDWDMNATDFILVAHGVADYTKIRTAQAIIVADNGTTHFFLGNGGNISGVTNGGISEITSTDIVLIRATGGTFDNTLYDSTGFNRGWLTITYEP